MPFTTFFRYATLLLPQAYWRTTEGRVGSGDPTSNYDAAMDAWEKAGGQRQLIVPMAGELGSSEATEIDEYAATASAQKRAVHFYAYEPDIKPQVWAAVKRA